MTTSTAGTKAQPVRKPVQRTPPSPGTVFVGQTLRKIRLAAGERPFAVVSVDTEADRASGWLFVHPDQDADDPLLKELGVQAADRRKPCYITVSTNLVK
jgi:hypothetical protein